MSVLARDSVTVAGLAVAGTRNRQTFAIWQGSQPAGFELQLEIKFEGLTANSGSQYRDYISAPNLPIANASTPAPPRHAKWNLAGDPFDFNFPGNYNGQAPEARTAAHSIDEDLTKSQGLIGLQCAGSGPANISLRNIWLKQMEQNRPNSWEER
jgi:hypothetical protein